MRNLLVKINPETKQAQFLDISPWKSLLIPKLRKPVHGKMVIGTTQGKIGIVQDDFSLKEIDLGGAMNGFIEADNSRMIAYGDHFLRDGKMWARVFIIDIDSRNLEQRLLEGPEAEEGGSGKPYLQGKRYIFGPILNISRDLNYMYYLYSWGTDGNSTTPLSLGMFDLTTQKESISIPGSIGMVTGSVYDQYENIWYYDRRSLESGSTPRMLNMSTLKPVVDLDRIMRNENSSKLLIAPFRNSFLFGTNNQVNIVSFSGAIDKTYALPTDWIDQDYALLEYRG
jgi:hypothetical protein